jgi:hypothetical protein
MEWIRLDKDSFHRQVLLSKLTSIVFHNEDYATSKQVAESDTRVSGSGESNYEASDPLGSCSAPTETILRMFWKYASIFLPDCTEQHFGR